MFWKLGKLPKKVEYPKNDKKLSPVTVEKEVLGKNISEVKNNVLEARISGKFSIDILSYAVSMQETWNCTKWYGLTHNNCFWIKHWNTVLCPWVPKLAMCKFNSPEESYEAFKIIWTKWYGEIPDINMAKKWSWDDRAEEWLDNVLWFYNDTYSAI